jgi:thioredoxin-like negative regulator of GroEL
MKNLIFTLITIISFVSSDVPDKYWIDDNNFEDTISNSSAFGDDNLETIVVEFWAEFNEANCFTDWNKIQNAKYYRVDIAKAPLAKKKYKVRMVPTIIIFKEGSIEESFKAGLDLTLPADLNDIQEAIDEINTASAF